MKRILLIILALSFVLTPYAQKTAQRKKTATTARTVRTQKKTPKKKPVSRRQSKAPTRAEKKLGWKARIKFPELVKIMVDSDLKAAGLNPIGDGYEIIKKQFPDRWWAKD